MKFTIVDVPQRSAEWFAARVGRLTSSRACDMLATIKSGEAAARRDLRMQLVVERLTGLPQDDGYVSKDMQRGIDKETDALAAYEAATGQLVRRTGFLAHPQLLAGCSPDGLIGHGDGALEIKCPKSSTHVGYLRNQTVPKDYLAQITHVLFITGARWCDFVSFDDRFPPALRLWIRRVERSSVDLTAYELALRLFLSEVEKEYADLQHLAEAGSFAVA